MGDVVPFIARVRSDGDWTAAERARLEELAERLSAMDGARVEAVFGATDAGDPWCVVTDQDGDVLIHVARIGGKFVVHSAVDDTLSEDADLQAALRERLNSDLANEPDSGVVVPFHFGGRQAQTFLALLIATSFFYETVGFADAAEAATPLAPELPAADAPPPPPDLKVPTQERELAIQGAALSEPGPARTAALVAADSAAGDEIAAAQRVVILTSAEMPTFSSARAEGTVDTAAAETVDAEPAQVRVVGTAGNDLLVGTAADERIQGGDGDDTLAGGGGNDLLEGGAGDDQIQLGVGVTATGGSGADTFVILAPETLGQAETLLGVVTDFNHAEGDRLMLGSRSAGPMADAPQAEPSGAESAALAPPGPGPAAGGASRESVPTLTGFGPGADGLGPSSVGPGVQDPQFRVDVDVDGDGVIDGYVLVTMAPGAPIADLDLAAGVGRGFDWSDLFG